ncbi:MULTISPECIES: hypothetical protein [Fusobacterium]|uniref:hypothetical protein n=1 Tax=Fusobacterium TaxID=848 RepID=UPI0007878ECA|nr:hypothetical protein [Fusobacterium necrophorum]KYM48178.1 conjugal transfer protein TrbJ [Fusobacterium necrophorum subsp. funduliforme]MDK4494976.1 conjugal transfer protein TrbJ [Fusobacterium necrophorum]
MKLWKKIVVIFCIFSLSSFSGFSGIFGGGSSKGIGKIVKILIAMQAKQALMETELGKELFEAVQQTQNQLKQIEMEMTNMLSLTQELTTGQLLKLQQDYQELLSIQNQFQNTLGSFKNFENQFQNTYKDFKDLKGLTSLDYIQQADDLLTASRNLTKETFAMAGLGSSEKMANDAQRITELMKAANSAEGQKAVMQAGVNMAGEQARMLGEMRTLLAASLKAQNAEIMRSLQNEKAGVEKTKQVLQVHESKNYKKPDLLNGKW